MRELASRGHRVAVAGRDRRRIEDLFRDLTVEARQADVRENESLRQAFAGIETVVNAVQFPNSPIEDRRKGSTFEQIDYQGTVKQLAAAKAAGVRRFVYVSGVGASPNAEKHWFTYKWQAERVRRPEAAFAGSRA